MNALLLAGFDDQDRDFRILRKSASHNTSSRASTNDNEIEALRSLLRDSSCMHHFDPPIVDRDGEGDKRSGDNGDSRKFAE